MASFSVKELCKQLISLAIQRCRLSGDPCRLSVVIRQSSGLSDLLVTQVSISDTGSGSCLKEFQDLRYITSGFSAAGCDGMLSITTTSLCDSEIFHYRLNLVEAASSRRLLKLPSTSKNNAKFSGTEVSMSTTENIEVIASDITSFFRKLLILQTYNIALELVAEFGDQQGAQHENVLLASELASLPSPGSPNIEQLALGLEDYVQKHGNALTKKCLSCYPNSNNLKVGTGLASLQKHMHDEVIVEAVVIISESSDPSSPSCLKAFEQNTEVLYFRDFAPCSVHQSDLKALSNIKWNSYGLSLRSIADGKGSVLLEWESLPQNTRIDIALHCYNKKVVVPPFRKSAQLERKLMKKSIALAFDDLKEKYSGTLLSAHALKIQSYAPDLAKSIAGLILSTDSSIFQHECFSILGLQLGSIEQDSVENCIKDKIISAIDMNDSKARQLRCREPAAFLFGDDPIQEHEYMLDECEQGEEEDYTLMDF